MALFEHPDFDNHELVAFHNEPSIGLRAIIAVHNTNLGASIGGCRMWNYANSAEALTDVLRLSKGMTYKAAMANLPQGGGKAVIMGDPRTQKSKAMMLSMGEFVNSIGGNYIIAEDSGIAVSDIDIMGSMTKWVAGNFAKFSVSDEPADGNPAPSTAYGVYCGIKAAVKHKFNSDLEGVHIAIQGVGHVGRRLAKLLYQSGAVLSVADVHDENARFAMREYNATAFSPDDIHAVACDVFSPCALGGTINGRTITELKAHVVAGAANNQLADAALDQELRKKNITYVPDYVINAGGIIDIHYQKQSNSTLAQMQQHLESIGTTVSQVIIRSDETNRGTQYVANEMAEQKFIK
ncbi:MAG: Glu/Leu/Phe/Val dehydrogenase dimerization domain-containing protein [Pseudomonadota bacterium]